MWTKVCIWVCVRPSRRWTETGHWVDAGFLHFAVFGHRIQRNLRILSLNLDFQVVIKICLPNREDTTYFIYLAVCQIDFKYLDICRVAPICAPPPGPAMSGLYFTGTKMDQIRDFFPLSPPTLPKSNIGPYSCLFNNKLHQVYQDGDLKQAADTLSSKPEQL